MQYLTIKKYKTMCTQKSFFKLFCTGIIPVLLASACGDGKNHEGSGLFDRFPVVAEYVINSDGDTVVVCDFSRLKDTLDLPLSTLFSGFEIVNLEEENDDALVGDGKVFASEHHAGIYSTPAGGYKLFDKSGKYLCSLSSLGQGPHEYTIGIYDSYIDDENNRAWLLPWRSKYILVYDLQGNFQQSIPLAYGVLKGVFRADVQKRQVTVAVLPFEDTPSVIWVQDFEGNIISEIPAKHFAIIPPDYSNEVDASQNMGEMNFSLFHWVAKNDYLYHYDESANRLKPVFTVRFTEGNMHKHDYDELPGYYLTRIWDERGQSCTLAMIDRKTLRGGYVRPKLDMLGNIPGPSWITFNRGYYIANMFPFDLKEQLEAALSSPALDAETKELLHQLNETVGEEDNNYLLIGKLKQPSEISLQEKIQNGESAITIPQPKTGEPAKSKNSISPPRKSTNDENIPPPAPSGDEDNKVYRWNKDDMKQVKSMPYLPDANEYFRKNNKYADWDMKDKRDVMVGAIVEKDGKASSIEVKESSGVKELDDEAVRLLENAVLHPGISIKDKPIRFGDFAIVVFFPPLSKSESPRSRGR
jgi:hypothetical protein